MCVGTPMKVISVEGLNARCEDANGLHDLSLALTGPVEPGTYVLAFLGSAARVLDEKEAQQIADALSAVSAAASGQPFDHLIEDLVNREPQLPEHLR